jgi:hypothetical protein
MKLEEQTHILNVYIFSENNKSATNLLNRKYHFYDNYSKREVSNFKYIFGYCIISILIVSFILLIFMI